MQISKIAKVLTGALLLSLGLPTIQAPLATADATITKTFTVTGSDGAPYAGALVGIFSTDSTEHYWPVVATDSSGHASVTIPINENFVQWEVEPRAGDVTNSILTASPMGYAAGESPFINESISVRFGSASKVVDVFLTDGVTEAPINVTWVGYPTDSLGNQTMSWLLRTGPVGISLPNNLQIDALYYLRANLNTKATLNYFKATYGLKASGSVGSETYNIYTSATSTTLLTPDTNGVLHLVLPSGTLQVQLKNGDGTNLSLPTGVTGSVEIDSIGPYGEISNTYSRRAFSTGGVSYLKTSGLAAGAYQVRFDIENSTSIPYFIKKIWVDSSGKVSTTSGTSGFSTATDVSPLTWNVTVPAPNFKFNLFKPDGVTPDSGNLTFSEKMSGQYFNSVNGSGSVNLPDGVYYLNINSNSYGIADNNYTLSIVSGVASLLDENNSAVSQSGGAFPLKTKLANLQIQGVSPTDGSLIGGVNFDVYQRNTDGTIGNYATGGYTNAGIGSALVSPGKYVLQIWKRPDYGISKYNVDVASNGAVTISGRTPSNGIFSLPLTNANFKFVMPEEYSTGQWGEWYQLCSGTKINMGTNCVSDGVDQSLMGGVTLSPGDFVLEVHPVSALLADGIWHIHVALDGTISIPGASQVNGIWSLPGATANIKFQVSNPKNSSLLTSGWINFGLEDSYGNVTEWEPNADLRPEFPGLAQAYLADGKYRVQVNSGDPSLGLAASTYELTMSSGVPSLTLKGVAVSMASGRFPVSPATANFNFQMTDPTNSNAVIKDGWFNACQDIAKGPNATGDCVGVGFDVDGIGHASLDPGKWYLRVNPGAAENASQAIYSATVDSAGAVTVTGITAPSGSSPWILPALSPTITGHVVDSTNQPISVVPNTGQGFSINLQEIDTNNNWIYAGNGFWRQSSTFGANVTSLNDVTGTNHYRFVVSPNNLTGYSDSFSPEFWITGAGKYSLVSGTDAGATSTLTNFNITLKAPNLNLELKNPIDNSDLPGGWVTFFTVDTLGKNGERWFGNANIANDGTGLAKTNLPDGTYHLQINPQIGNGLLSGLSRSDYKIVVTGNGSSMVMTTFTGTTPISKVGSNFVLYAAKSNITGRLVAADGTAITNGQNQWVNINLQKQDSYGNWNYDTSWYGVDANGNFSLSQYNPGTYRLLIDPQGFSNASRTYSPTFTITSSNASNFSQDFGTFTLLAPDLIVNVLAGTSTTPVQNVNINVLQNNMYIANAYTGPSGVASINFPSAGQYTLHLYPDQTSIQNGFTQIDYVATVAVATNGTKSVSFANSTGVGTGSNGAITLKLGSANIAGTVTVPGASTAVPYSQVVPYDSNGNGLWQYSSQSSSTGKWAMLLPQGAYTLQAQAPYGDITHGSSDRIGTITVASDGSVSLSGTLSSASSATNLVIPLRNPTWSGIIEAPAPSTTPVPFAQVCLLFNNNWTCNQADAQGRWALSAPTGFTAFDANSQLQIGDVQGHQYANTVITGSAAVSSALGGTSGSNIALHLQAPNVFVQVMAGTAVAPYVNVNLLDGVTNQWIGNAQSNAAGIASFKAQNLNQALIVQADPNGNPAYSGSYAYTTLTTAATTDSVETVTVSLAAPNILGVVRAKTVGTTLGNPVAGNWIEFDSVDSNGNTFWLGSTGTDSEGKFAYYAPPSAGSKIQVHIHASVGGLTNGTDSAYIFTLNCCQVSSVVLLGTTTNPPTETIAGRTYYDLSLLAPNVTGVVKDASGAPIQNAWIQYFNQLNKYAANYNLNTDQTGSFGASLPNGDYQVQANPPWNSLGNSKSSICQFTVSSGALGSTSAGCNAVGSPKQLQLQLHAPNLTFTLLSGTTPIANANVNIGLGAWNTWANSDSNGLVSLYVDSADIALLNPGLTGTVPLNLWFNPPYGQSNLMVQSYCYSGKTGSNCQSIPSITIGTAFNSGNQLALGNIQVQGPNTRLQIKTPSGSPVGAGYWINLVSYDTGTGQSQNYLGGTSTDSSGIAYFNLDTHTATSNTVYGVSIYPNGTDQGTYSAGYVGDYQQYGDWAHGLTWAQLTSPSTLLSPSTPNVYITVSNGDGTLPDRYGWVNITQFNNSGNPIRGNGAGLNYSGNGSMVLSANGIYTLTAYPNNVSGAPTTCSVTTDGSANVSISGSTGTCTLTSANHLNLLLSLGNIHGTLVGTDGVTPIVGALILAQLGSDTSTAVTTCSGSNGAFGFNLDATKGYTITAISPVGTANFTKNIPYSTKPSSNDLVDLGTVKFGA